MYRHGDVSFHPISEEAAQQIIMRADSRKEKLDSFVVALGEVTGHKHVMTMERPAALTVEEILAGGDVLFRLGSKATMTHEEHAPIVMEPGIYIRKIEREFDPFAGMARQSAD